MSGWIGVDLDGTLAQYGGWQGADHIGEPVPAMLERVKRWITEGREVRIFTARVSGPQADEVESIVKLWLQKHGLPALTVTCSKDYGMIELWDDRAVQVVMNKGEPVGYSTRELA